MHSLSLNSYDSPLLSIMLNLTKNQIIHNTEFALLWNNALWIVEWAVSS